jgi:hypothetical protein
MSTHEFNNDSNQAERRSVQRDSYFSRAQAEAEIEAQGRFKKHNPTIVTGVTTQYPRPSSGPWATPDPTGPEPPFPIDIEFVGDLGGASPALPCAGSATPTEGGSSKSPPDDPPSFSHRRSWDVR